MNTPAEGDEGRGTSWIQPEIQQKIRWRDGDIVISVPPKSGTTWTMNIVHQLLTGGDSDFRDIYEVVPWIEFLSHPEQSHEEVLSRLDAMATTRPRAFKTHSAPPIMPFFESGSGQSVKYIVVFRNPEEAVVSFWPFFQKHSDEWFDLWGVPKEAMARPDFESFYYEIVDEGGVHANAFFGFLKAWWPLRHEKNVLFMHFADMKRDREGSIRKIAQFLDIEPTAEQWPKILEYTSFDWMKRHENKFEAATVGKVPILKTGAMIRKGEAGSAKADGMTDEIARHLRNLGNQVCPDTAALNWFYEGGDRP